MPERSPAPPGKRVPVSPSDTPGTGQEGKPPTTQQSPDWEQRIAFQVRCFVFYYSALLVLSVAALAWLWQNAPRVQAWASTPWLQRLVLPLATTMLGGTVGNVLYNIRVMYQHYIKQRDYDPRWWGKYLSGPLEAAVLALVVYALIRGGVAAMAGLPVSEAPREDQMGITLLGSLGLGTLVGFSIRDVIGWLQQLSKNLFRHEEDHLGVAKEFHRVAGDSPVPATRPKASGEEPSSGR